MRNITHQGIQFKGTMSMNLTKEDYDKGFCPTTIYEIPDDPTLNDLFKININTSKLIGLVDAAHANDLKKRYSTTGIVFTFMGGVIVYKSKT